MSSQQVPNFNISIPERMYPINESNNLTNVLGKEPVRVVNDFIKPTRITAPNKPLYNEEDFMTLVQLQNNRISKLFQKEIEDKSLYDAINASYGNLRKKTLSVVSKSSLISYTNNPMYSDEDVVVPKPKRGRPLGSKDTKPRQRRQPLRIQQEKSDNSETEQSIDLTDVINKDMYKL
jgi:hypothetical protein